MSGPAGGAAHLLTAAVASFESASNALPLNIWEKKTRFRVRNFKWFQIFWELDAQKKALNDRKERSTKTGKVSKCVKVRLGFAFTNVKEIGPNWAGSEPGSRQAGIQRCQCHLRAFETRHCVYLVTNWPLMYKLWSKKSLQKVLKSKESVLRPSFHTTECLL